MAAREPAKEPILCVCIIGFHHSKGSVVEFSYPERDLSQLKYLVHLALPDGAHNVEEGSVCFTVLSENQNLFAVSCYRQISTLGLKNLDTDITRSSIQKAVCILSHIPAYGLIQSRLKMVTEAYFSAGEFSDRSILLDLYAYLNKSLASIEVTEYVFVEVDPVPLLVRHQYKVLQVFKALLLGRTVMLFSDSAEEASRGVLVMASLIPNCLQHLLEGFGTIPLALGSQTAILPYAALQEMDNIKQLYHNRKLLSFGTSNLLFERKQSELCDVFLNLSTGYLLINSPLLKSLLKLSLADLRFSSLLCQAKKDDLVDHQWVGSEDYIRAKFSLYCHTLLNTAKHGSNEEINDFNSAFVEEFKEQLSSLQVSGVEGRKEGCGTEHPCRQALSFEDLKRKVAVEVDNILTEEQRESVKEAVTSTRDKLTDAWTKTSTALWNWWSGKEEDRQ